MKKLLIDAISTNSGGAISHLKSLLEHFDSQKRFDKVEVHVPFETIKLLPKNKKIKYISFKFFEKFLIFRILWQVIWLNIILKIKKYNCVFVTGSSHFLFFKCIVTISQNLLPFNKFEVNKYFFSFFYIKLLLIKITQTLSFKRSKGLIFLHRYSKKIILSQIGKVNAKIKVIPHSISQNYEPINQKFSKKKIRFIYISNIDYYKNHEFLIKSINDLFNKNPLLKRKIFFEFYGKAYKPALKKIINLIKLRNKSFINFKYLGIKKKKLIYKKKKDYFTIAIFCSSCENFSVAVLEAVAFKLPMLCVDLNPMKSVLKNYAMFYRYNSNRSLQNKILQIIYKPKSIQKKTSNYLDILKDFKPSVVAFKTYEFLYELSK